MFIEKFFILIRIKLNFDTETFSLLNCGVFICVMLWKSIQSFIEINSRDLVRILSAAKFPSRERVQLPVK
ncbi:MAG: hypothetical protein JWP44_3330 [Mucilaginibacter sp.]|nr:hypothetical protein [Mucilaginibacter sp.]